MPYRIEHDAKNSVTRLLFQGAITESVFLEATAAGRDFVRTSQSRAVLVDFSETTDFAVQAEFLRIYIRSTQTVLPASGRYYVAPADSLYGLARLFRAHRDPDGSAANVVRTADEAYRMIGIAEPEMKMVFDSERVSG